MFKAAKAGPQKIVTANRLTDGRVIFLGPGNRWIADVGEAATFEDGAPIDAAMAFGREQIAARQVTELYPVDVELVDGRPVPVRLRERVRAFGPTVAYGEAELRRLRNGGAAE